MRICGTVQKLFLTNFLKGLFPVMYETKGFNAYFHVNWHNLLKMNEHYIKALTKVS